jgi:ABC-type Zn uptake system ZnuABC Zn-binding protein ZnuA
MLAFGGRWFGSWPVWYRGGTGTVRRIRLGTALLVVGLVATGCSSQDPSAGTGGRLRVVSTVSPVTNIIQNVGGDRVDVTGIVPEGTNSHTFEPAPSDARVLAQAEVVFINGLHLEEPTRKLAKANVPKGVEIVQLGELTIKPAEYIYDFSFPRSQGDPNPHLWTNPPYAKRYAEIVRDTLAALRPDDASTFRSNYERFAQRIDALDKAAREVTATVPASNRKLLTYHDSFPYFAREYGWKIIGAIQPSDFTEPTPREVQALIDQIRREKVPAIFGSEVFPSPVLAKIAKEAGARYVEDLRDDDLPGKRSDPNHSYIALMVFDFKTFMGALGGNPSAFSTVDTTNVAGSSTTAHYRE